MIINLLNLKIGSGKVIIDGNASKIMNINENTIDKINVVINTVTNHLILEFVLEFFSLLIFELVTLLFSATLFFLHNLLVRTELYIPMWY